jgi:nitroreductase
MQVKMTDERTARIVDAACAAPSIHNSQPWQFEAAGDELLLRGVVDRALWVADPDARALYISCGAALFNARIAARRAGLDSDVTLLPHPEHPFDVLAVMRFTRGQDPSPGEARLYEAIWQRHTNRRPYSPARIPPMLVAGLQNSAVAEDATLRMLNRQDTAAVLDLAAEAGREVAASRLHQDELRRWIKDGADDGIPQWALPSRPAVTPAPVRDVDLLAAAPRRGGRADYERHPQIAVLTTEHDEPADWLQAGQALQHVLLVATLNGLSASFLYHLIERDDMLGGGERTWPWPEHPQMIIRLGYGQPAVPTPRRSSGDATRAAGRLPATH